MARPKGRAFFFVLSRVTDLTHAVAALCCQSHGLCLPPHYVFARGKERKRSREEQMKSAQTKARVPLLLFAAVATAQLAFGAPPPQIPSGSTPLGSPQLPLPVPRPDLELRVAWLQAPVSNVLLTSIPEGKSYRLCFKVRNIGPVASGPYRVGAGGLGIPVAPHLDFAGLGSGATQSGCIRYPTTPRAGSYRLGVTADSLYAVAEIREDNNDYVVPVTISPR
jgi:CARDB